MAQNKYCITLSLILIFVFFHAITKGANDKFTYYKFDDNHGIGLKIESKDKDKMLATLISEQDKSIKDSFFTNNLSEMEFNDKLKSFLEKKMSVDPESEGFLDKLSNLTYRMYITVPVFAVPENADKVTAVTLHVKKAVRLDDSKEKRRLSKRDAPDEVLRSPKILSDIWDYTLLEMQKLRANNKDVLKKDVEIKGILEKMKDGNFVHKIVIPGIGNHEIPLNKKNLLKTDPKLLSFKPSESILKGIDYTDNIKVYVECKYDKAMNDKIFSKAGVDSAIVKVSYEINVPELPFLKEMDKLTIADLEKYKEKYKLNWSKCTDYVGEDILNANTISYTHLRDKLTRIELEADEKVTAGDLKIRTFAQLYSLAHNLDSSNSSHREIDEALLEFIDLYQSNNNLRYEVNNIKMTINSGLIEDISVTGTYDGYTYVFENRVPIGFTSKHNIKKKFAELNLYAENEDGDLIRLPVRKLFDINHALFLNTKDFSPDDQEVNEDIKANNQVIKLTRDPGRDLIRLRAFTDLRGLNEEEPNGLIQIEASRQFSLWSTIGQAGRSRFFAGVFTYIKPYFLWSKIENKRKYLPLTDNDSLINGQFVPHKSVTLIDIYKYQVFQTGVELNLLLLGSDHVKTRVYFDLGIQYFLTRYYDTSPDSTGHTYIDKRDTTIKSMGAFNWYPQIKAQIAATDRIGIEGFWRFNYTSILNRDVRLITQQNESTPYKANYKGRFFTYSAEVFYKPVQKDKVYARVTFNVQPNSYNNHFYQIQIGYNSALFLNSKK
jgi:hypothetical protein